MEVTFRVKQVVGTAVLGLVEVSHKTFEQYFSDAVAEMPLPFNPLSIPALIGASDLEMEQRDIFGFASEPHTE